MKIFYGICGEGLGHSGRSLALVERLVSLGHSVTLFTFADAYRLLTQAGYRPHRIEGLRWRENSAGGVSTLGTACNFVRFLGARRESLDQIRQLARVEQPDLVITDFEPLTALAAASLRIPCVSVDNQHRFCHPLGNDFPRMLRAYSHLAGQFVRRWIKSPRECIVAVFHDCPPSRHYRRVDALMRGQIARVTPTDGDHILIYGRTEVGRRIADAASRVPARFVAYGFTGPAAPNIEYKRANYDEFAADLASCRAVLANAGHQLMSEARYFGKPLLVVPMPNQHEQAINAHYARREGFGDYCQVNELTTNRLTQFLDRRFSVSRPANGVDQTLELLGLQ